MCGPFESLLEDQQFGKVGELAEVGQRISHASFSRLNLSAVPYAPFRLLAGCVFQAGWPPVLGGALASLQRRDGRHLHLLTDAPIGRCAPVSEYTPEMAVREWLDLMERAWNAADHPRGPDGRFLGKGGAGKAKPSSTPRPRSKAPSSPDGGSSGDSGGGGKSDTGKSPAAPAKKPARAKPAAKPKPAEPGPAPPPKDKAFIDSHYGGWKDKLSPAQDKAMRFYQSPGFALMNGQLRGLDKKDIKADVSFNDADLARAAKASKDLHAAIRKAPPLEEPMTVYRGFGADQFGDLSPGMQISDKGFTSTSITNDVGTVGRATKQATAEITLPAGTKAAAGSSREMVLPPNSKFRVLSVTTRKGVPHVRMELVL